MLVLGLDFETTFTDPIDPQQARIIEVGAVVWEAKRMVPLMLVSRLVWSDDYAFDDRITELTGLTMQDLKKYGTTPQKMLNELRFLLDQCAYVVAHNGNGFDKPVLAAECERQGKEMPKTPWIDTTSDVPYPKKIETRKLDFLAPSHGFLNPFAHRALFDVVTMLKVMGNYNVEEVAKRATAQKVILRAVTQKPWEDGGKSNQWAKDRGFRFDGASKCWLKTVLDSEVDEQLCKTPVEVVRYK